MIKGQLMIEQMSKITVDELCSKSVFIDYFKTLKSGRDIYTLETSSYGRSTSLWVTKSPNDLQNPPELLTGTSNPCLGTSPVADCQ